jgi:hypothetical protein
MRKFLLLMFENKIDKTETQKSTTNDST